MSECVGYLSGTTWVNPSSLGQILNKHGYKPKLVQLVYMPKCVGYLSATTWMHPRSLGQTPNNHGYKLKFLIGCTCHVT